VHPIAARAAGYDDPAIDRVAFVQAAQAVGLTLGEIRQVVALRERGESPCRHVVHLLERRLTRSNGASPR
jgi:DNA-binding transcriptional MerR regulator